ncbi:MAG: hypothetical protein CM1200mP16_04500 [Nitrospina sp.]|nr:MAG: hypothetical protein CM1200mP16_04500 [Nitrospina sp.]
MRETLYSKGENKAGFFSREGLDLVSTLKGPTFEKVFETNNKIIPKVKHLLEPRLTFSYIPDLDRNDKEKIKSFDFIDRINPHSLINYSLTQRIFLKESDGKGDFKTREAVRFILSQSYDLLEGRETRNTGKPPRTFLGYTF